MKNVFELWRDGGEVVPFTVVRWSWNPRRSFFVVHEVQITKWPYGRAAGRFHGDGPYEELRNSGSYQWRLATV